MIQNLFSVVYRIHRLAYGLSFTIVITLLVFSGCSKGKTPDPDPVTVPVPEEKPKPEEATVKAETISLSFITPIAVELKGKIINEGKKTILDRGFVIAFGTNTGNKVSVRSDPVSDLFELKIDDFHLPLVDGVLLPAVVMAFVTDEKGTHYGNALSLEIGGMASKIQQTGGKTGDIITLTGNYLDMKKEDTKVQFGHVDAQVISVTDKTITAAVPRGIIAIHGEPVDVMLVWRGKQQLAARSFFIWANIKDAQPRTGPLGTVVRFTGDNLPLENASTALKVSFGDVPVIADYDTEYFFRVPSELSKDKVRLSYQQGPQSVELPFEFTVTPPVIKSMSPNPASKTDPITLKMENSLPHWEGEKDAIVDVGGFKTTARANEQGDFVFLPFRVFPTGQNFTVTITVGPHTLTAPEPLVFK
jgi:hypothetical protein